MNTSLVLAALLLIADADPQFRDREPHPLAPSLPLLTKAEEQRIEATIERFIQADIGKIRGIEAKKAFDDFKTLGPEATFNLIDGLNRTANMESSCPAVIIAKKLAGIFLATEDMQLLTFAKENIGAGVTAKRHLNVMHDLQTNILLRKGTLQRRALATKGAAAPTKSLSAMSLTELEQAARQNSPQLNSILTEAGKRQGAKAIDILATGIANKDAQIVKLSQGLLAKNLHHQTSDILKTMLKHNLPDVRRAAADIIGSKRLRFGKELIELLQDSDVEVRQASRRALVRLSGGLDHGPEPDASFGDREAAIERWQAWWDRQK